MNRENSPPESAKGLWYDPTINRFKDECGAILSDLGVYFPTWQLDAWKKTKEYGLLTDRSGDLWEVFYDRMNMFYCECQHNCDICPSKCEIYELIKG